MPLSIRLPGLMSACFMPTHTVHIDISQNRLFCFYSTAQKNSTKKYAIGCFACGSRAVAGRWIPVWPNGAGQVEHIRLGGSS